MWLFRRLDLGPMRSKHVLRVEDVRFKGSYASVWFDRPNPWAQRNESVPGAPAYYVEFTWKPFLKPEEAKEVLDDWLARHGLAYRVARWQKSYHIKYFYQAAVTWADGRGVKAPAELWWEANYNGLTGELWTDGEEPRGEVLVFAGLPLYRRLPFREVGLFAQHPLGFHAIFLVSGFVHQFLSSKNLGGGA